nr:ankyrin repeat-containing protein At2g01680-like [Ipomoea batatas]
MAQLRENRNKTTLPGNKITLDLLGAIAKDDVNQVENYIISPMDLMSYSVLCISCKMGSLNVAKSLANKNPHLCLEAGDDGRIPLHIAIMEGKAEIVKQLVLACPESLDYVTPHGETVIHFALLGNSNGDSCLNFLRQEIHRLDKHYLLEYLSPTNATTTASFEIEASTNSPQEVRIAVLDSNEATHTSPMLLQHQQQEQSSMLLKGTVFTAGVTYTGLFNFYTIFPHDNKNPTRLTRAFTSREAFFSPGSLPEAFWFLTVTTFAFVSSTISSLVAIWWAGSPWSFEVRAVSLLALSSLFSSYLMMLKTLVPHFAVVTASGHQILSGFELLCLYTFVALILSMAVALMVRILWTSRPR